ncbi:LOW QUALITY PROTEIN: hypothetical protein HID58_070519 [Brassica napus]|uniref:Uncharacterized protein n=1 Tax=Brassica napus TaxID=3708 RepID=A0ABQ7YZ30_BRANA|nr:LOW QUALITY PROTEIN: hypothetical protein HID58_070519 [Brassica napus]
MFLMRQKVFWLTFTNSGVLLSILLLFISMCKVESAPLYMTNQKQARFLSLFCPGGFMGLLFSYCFSLSIRIYCLFLSPPIQFVLGLAREDLSCPEIEISDSSILKETAAARLDAESLSNRSPTSGENGKVWELGGVWNWIINKKSRGSKLNFPNELVEYVKLMLFISMDKVESSPLYMTNQKQAWIYGFIVFLLFLSLSIRIYCLFLSPPIRSVLGLAREELFCPEIEISDSSIIKETAAARLDAELLSNGSPTSGKALSWFWSVSYNPINETISYLGCQLGENEKVWELGGVWNWIINKKNRGSKLNFPNALVEYRKCPSLYDQSKANAISLSLLSRWICRSVLGLAREDLSCPEIEISDSSILKMTAAARLDAESLSNRSPTSGKALSWFWSVCYNPINETGRMGKCGSWVVCGVWNLIINKKSRGSKLNFPNELVE